VLAERLLDRLHLGAVEERREIEAAGDGAPVDDHGATAAESLRAAFARAVEPEPLQDLDDVLMRFDGRRYRLPVQLEGDRSHARTAPRALSRRQAWPAS